MKRTKNRQLKSMPRFESQDDAAYLTGRHSPEDEEKQIKTPSPRRGGDRDENRRADSPPNEKR